MEHLASNTLNIKELLTRMQKFIAGKSINSDKANNLKDLNDIGKAIWEFISMVYDSHWDSLYVDNNNTTFRSKVKSKFSPQVKNIQPLVSKGKEVVKPLFVLVILSLFQPNRTKKSKKFWNSLKKLKNQLQTNCMLRLHCLNQSPMHHLLTLLWICWKSRRHSWTFQTRKSILSRKLLTVQMTNPNPDLMWLWKAPHTNKSLFL